MAQYQKKTQIYMSNEQWARLQRESGLKGSSVAEVIRQSIDEHFGHRDATGFESVLKASAGVVKDGWNGSSEGYVRALREGWHIREEREFGDRVSD